MKIPRPNTTGLAFGAIYIASMAICVIKAQFIDDPKGRYIMLQLPVAL